jgi:hypothetical protein
LQNEDVEPPAKKSAVEEQTEHESQVKATDAFVASYNPLLNEMHLSRAGSTCTTR